MSKGMEDIHIVCTILRCVKAASQQITLEREELFTVSTGHRKLRSRTYYISYCCSMFEYALAVYHHCAAHRLNLAIVSHAE